MNITRRSFLHYALGSTLALGLDFSVASRLREALAAGGEGLPTVIWLNGANCTGCTISLANLAGSTQPKNVAELLLYTIDLAYHPNLMGAAGSLAVDCLTQAAAGDFILAVDGGIPTAFDGHTCLLWTETDQSGAPHEVTALEAVQRLAPQALAVLAIGTCASFGGIPAAQPNPTGITTVRELTGLPTIHIPGCPPHPDWIVWTIATLLGGGSVRVDGSRRPTALFQGEGRNVHEKCPREERKEAKDYGQEGLCLKELGCKGPRTQGDCPTRLWNNQANWCVGANAQCIGCTEPGFPDSFSPFYKPGSGQSSNPVPQTLAVTHAVWEAGDKLLDLRGTATGRARVYLFAANTGVQLGGTQANGEGRWTFRKAGLAEAPCTVEARANGQRALSSVEGAPADCGQQGPPDPNPDPGLPATNLQIVEARWQREESRLIVRGQALRGTEVSIYRAADGAKLGGARANSRNEWSLVLEHPSRVPCRVGAKTYDGQQEAAVRYAPGNCV
ncbi:MAG: hydrogenase small subunit [Deltaproteobacteria bacterium]|nr:hydrogenase small subunit [Deltaproteobacteria bacterium]